MRDGVGGVMYVCLRVTHAMRLRQESSSLRSLYYLKAHTQFHLPPQGRADGEGVDRWVYDGRAFPSCVRMVYNKQEGSESVGLEGEVGRGSGFKV